MSQNYEMATVFGGTGFIGTQVVRELAKAGYRIKVATRIPERAYVLKTCGNIGQVVPFVCDYTEESIANAIQGSDVVVNLVGLLFEKKRGDFERAHVTFPSLIAKVCAEQKVQRFVHLSALGVDDSQSKYAKTKLAGEFAVHENFPDATVLRPSVVFGPDDDFFNMFGKMARFLPFLPLIGGGKTKFQPVFVGDVADAVVNAIKLPDMDDKSPKGQVYELGGPEVLSFKDIYDRLFQYTQCKRALVPLPFAIAKLQGTAFSFGMKTFGILTGYMPKPPLTADQVESLKTDTVVGEQALSLKDLGVEATTLDAVLATYLKRFQPGGRFGNKKSAS